MCPQEVSRALRLTLERRCEAAPCPVSYLSPLRGGSTHLSWRSRMSSIFQPVSLARVRASSSNRLGRPFTVRLAFVAGDLAAPGVLNDEAALEVLGVAGFLKDQVLREVLAVIAEVEAGDEDLAFLGAGGSFFPGVLAMGGLPWGVIPFGIGSRSILWAFTQLGYRPRFNRTW